MDQRTSRGNPGKRDRLIEHFVAGTTARAAAELVGGPRNTAMLFYQRLRRVIVEELTKASPLSGESRSMKGILADGGKATAGVEPPAKSLFSAF